jgi:hypothetical protein
MVQILSKDEFESKDFVIREVLFTKTKNKQATNDF